MHSFLKLINRNHSWASSLCSRVCPEHILGPVLQSQEHCPRLRLHAGALKVLVMQPGNEHAGADPSPLIFYILQVTSLSYQDSLLTEALILQCTCRGIGTQNCVNASGQGLTIAVYLHSTKLQLRYYGNIKRNNNRLVFSTQIALKKIPCWMKPLWVSIAHRMCLECLLFQRPISLATEMTLLRWKGPTLLFANWTQLQKKGLILKTINHS